MWSLSWICTWFAKRGEQRKKLQNGRATQAALTSEGKKIYEAPFFKDCIVSCCLPNTLWFYVSESTIMLKGENLKSLWKNSLSLLPLYETERDLLTFLISNLLHRKPSNSSFYSIHTSWWTSLFPHKHLLWLTSKHPNLGVLKLYVFWAGNLVNGF